MTRLREEKDDIPEKIQNNLFFSQKINSRNNNSPKHERSKKRNKNKIF